MQRKELHTQLLLFMGIGSVLTGLSIYKPVQFHMLCALLGGYEWARAEHFILTILFVLFFVVHIIQVILAGWNNFSSMVTGLDVLKPGKIRGLQPVAVTSETGANQLARPMEKIFATVTIPAETGPDELIPVETKSLPEAPATETEIDANDLPSADTFNRQNR